MSHLEDLAKSMGISSDELFSGKYGSSYDEILDNLMMKELNRESYAYEDLDLEKKDCQLCNFTVTWKKGDDWQKEDAEREFKEHQNNKHGIVESYASERSYDWYVEDYNALGEVKQYFHKGTWYSHDDLLEYGAECKLCGKLIWTPDRVIKDRYIDHINEIHPEVSATEMESYASEDIEDAWASYNSDSDYGWSVDEWYRYAKDHGISFDDAENYLYHMQDDSGNVFEESYASESPFSGMSYNLPDVWTCPTCSQQINFSETGLLNSPIRVHLESHGFTDDQVSKIMKTDTTNFYDMNRIIDESYASEDSLVKIEDDDDKDTKVTVLDEWENETDPDVGGDVEGLDQDQKDSRESWGRKSFNQKVEALEAVGFRQGKALRFASLAFEDFSKELQEAIDSVTQEDAEDEQEFIRQTQEDEKEAGLVEEVDYNNIGESRTARSKYECEFCNCGFKSNESLTIHYNDIHAVPPAQIDGYEAQPELEAMMSYNDESQIAGWVFRNYNVDYNDLKEEEKQKYREEYKDRYIGNSWQEGGENWKEVADDLYKKELAKLKKRGGEAHGDEEGTSDGAKKGWLTRKRGGKTEEPITKKQTKTNTKLDKVKGKLLSKLNSGSDYYVKVANLDGYPQNPSQLRGVPAGVKGVIMKSQLTDSYDGATFSVKKRSYDSLNVGWTGGDGGYPYGAQKIADLYSDKGSTNLMVDYYDIDTYVGSVYDERKDRHKRDPSQVADTREERFGWWIYTKINEDWSGYREKFGDHIDLSVTKTMADHILNEPDVTGFNNIKYSDFADLKKEFLEEEKRTGGGNNPKDLPKSSSASSYSQQYMGEDPSKPSEIPYDPNTGEELPVSRFNPNDTKYRQPKETDTVSDMAKAYGDMMAKKKNPDEPMWANGESYANESEFTCPYCKSDDISTDKYEYFKCNNCNRPFDIPHEEPEYDPYIESYANEENPNHGSDGKFTSNGSSNKKTMKFYKPIDELGSTVMDQIESGDKNGVLRQWIKDQSDNKEQKSKIDMIKKELNKRGISTESYATEDDYKYDFEDLTSLAQDKIESSGVTQSEWDSTPEEEREELEKEIREAYNPSDLVCPECGDITKDDKEFEDHLSTHRFDDGGY